MNPFVSRITNQNWVMPITGMCLVLGFMISLSWVTEQNRTSRIGLVTGDQRNRVNAATVDIEEFQRLSQEVQKLREENTKMQNSLANESGQAKVLNDSLQGTKVFAAMTEVEGPGIIVTLRDNAKAGQSVPQPGFGGDTIIHDIDVLRVVNELYASGAEALSINNRRLSVGSSIRCVGPVIHIDSVPIASPVVIRAVGDSATLLGALNLPLGVLAEIRTTDPSMVQVETAVNLRLPAYAGSTARKYAKPPKEKK